MVKVTTPDLPTPDEAKLPGWKEVARIWRHDDGEQTLCSASIRTISNDPTDWSFVLASLARSAARPFILGSSIPRKMRDSAIDTLAYRIVRETAEDDFAEVDEIITEVEEMMGDDEVHPGELQIPDAAWARPDAVEAISVWITPDLECPGCGETHQGGAFAGVTLAEHLSAEDFGHALASAARTCARMIVDTRGGDFDSVFMTIQAAMLAEPVAEDYGLQTPPTAEHKH